MKKLFAVFLSMAMLLSLLTACDSGGAPADPSPSQAPETAPPAAPATQDPATQAPDTLNDIGSYLWEVPDDAGLDRRVALELRNGSLIQAMEPIFEDGSYSAYSRALTSLKGHKDEEHLAAVREAREGLQQTVSVADGVYFLWKDFDSMPIVDGESYTEEELDSYSLLGYGYTTVMIKYLLDDPAAAKGNIVMVSGGAMKGRSNGSEGYPAAEVFNALGYNCFLVQRRVEPYSNMDIFMDFARAIRVVRYHAEQEGWGGRDMIAGMGWSGGGATLMGAVNYFYGDVQFSQYDSGYVPDEIDAVSADLDVALPIYGGSLAEGSGNTALPAFYIVHGTNDDTVPTQSSIDLYDAVKDQVPAELELIEGAPHGFGVGTTNDGFPEGCRTWVDGADRFMQAHLGHQSSRPIPFPEAAEAYTKVKSFYGYYILQDSDVLFALNEDETRFCVKFNTFAGEREIVLEGTVEDGVCTVDPGLNGLFGEDVQLMYEDALADPAPWAPIA